MKRLLTTLLVLALVACTGIFAGHKTSEASWDWCFSDPLVLVQGRVLDVQSGIPVANLRDLDGPVDVKLYLPDNVKASVLLNLGVPYQERVTIVRTGATWKPGTDIPVHVEVTAHSAKSFDTSMLVTHQGGLLKLVDIAMTHGKSNSAMTGDFRLTPLLGLLP
ncbi:MAG TPA: hypothetical protein VH951_06990 [Dehalococcoidia bacterium]